MKYILVLLLIFSIMMSSSCGVAFKKMSTEETDSSDFTIPAEKFPTHDLLDMPDVKTVNYNDIKAMWLSQFDMISVYTDNGKQRDKEDFTQRTKRLLNNVTENGFNTVILQLRPNGDSIYPSQVYPPSKYAVGSYGKTFEYDPVAIILETAHSMGLSVHAWINPLRCMNIDEIDLIDKKYKLKQWLEDAQKNSTYIVSVDGKYYLNPAYTEVRELICRGVKEIFESYRFDGCHMDDYFYPTDSPEFDASAFTEHKKTSPDSTLKEFRYNNLNCLVAGIYKTVKKASPTALVGISPEGNVTNATEYDYADIYTWCRDDGYIDYICPQIYYGLKHQTHPFENTVEVWSKIITNPKIKLVVGMTFGKVLSKTDKWAGSGSNEWAEDSDIMVKCLKATEKPDNCTGIAVFCYQYYYNPKTETEVLETKQERDSFTLLLKNMSWHKKTIER